MTPVEKFDAWASKHGLQVIAYTVVVALAWASLTAAVAQKADKADVQAMSNDLKAIKSLICKDHPGDSLCR